MLAGHFPREEKTWRDGGVVLPQNAKNNIRRLNHIFLSSSFFLHIWNLIVLLIPKLLKQFILQTSINNFFLFRFVWFNENGEYHIVRNLEITLIMCIHWNLFYLLTCELKRSHTFLKKTVSMALSAVRLRWMWSNKINSWAKFLAGNIQTENRHSISLLVMTFLWFSFVLQTATAEFDIVYLLRLERRFVVWDTCG